jgi:predicted anti-sigma-YlaC factor YlaD
MKHYTREELELYRNGKMSVLSRISCSCHLRECEACRQLMEELKDDDALVDKLRSSIQLYQELLQTK